MRFVSLIVTLALAAPVLAATPTPEQVAKARQTLTSTLTDAIVAPLRTWEVEEVDKPSFPFVVDKVAARVRPQANAMVESNYRAVQQVISKPQVRMQVINALAEAGLDGQADNAMVDALAAKLAANAKPISAFYDEDVTLAIVGWGSGDHESVTGYAPSNPKSVAKRLLNGVPELLFPAPAAPAPAAH